MSQNESTPFLWTYAKNLTLIDVTRENLPMCCIMKLLGKRLDLANRFSFFQHNILPHAVVTLKGLEVSPAYP